MPNHGTPRRFSLAKAVQEEAVLGGGVGHLGGDHRPAVQGAEAGDDGDQGDELADPAAVEHGVEGGDERGAVIDQLVVGDEAHHHGGHGDVQQAAGGGADHRGPPDVAARVLEPGRRRSMRTRLR